MASWQPVKLLPAGMKSATALSPQEGFIVSTSCQCGFDYQDFISHHAIPMGARFSCPSCECELTVDHAMVPNNCEFAPGFNVSTVTAN